MPEEGFLRRWARVKASGPDAAAEAPPRAPAAESASASTPASSPAAPARWARAGDTLPAPPATQDDAAPAGEPATAGRPSPTLEDVARLTPDSDYSIFVGKGVDKSVQRLALKKLFADPHFNVPDRLDMYMDDYNIPSPVSEAMLASLDHARSALRRVVDETPAPPAALAEPVPANGEAQAEQAVPPESAAPHTAAPDAVGHEAVPHNEAAHATAAPEDPLDTPSVAATHDHGPFPRPNQHLPQGQA